MRHGRDLVGELSDDALVGLACPRIPQAFVAVAEVDERPGGERPVWPVRNRLEETRRCGDLTAGLEQRHGLLELPRGVVGRELRRPRGDLRGPGVAVSAMPTSRRQETVRIIARTGSPRRRR